MTTTRIKELFLEALELPISERESWLQANCANEQAIIESVKELLSSHDRPSIKGSGVFSRIMSAHISRAVKSEKRLPTPFA